MFKSMQIVLAAASVMAVMGTAPMATAANQQLAVSTLHLPGGKTLTTRVGGISSAKWEDLNVSLQVIGVPERYPYGQSVTGNHSQIISRQWVHTPNGKAWFALNERTQPAASKSKKVTYEYWLAIERKSSTMSVDYCVEAIVTGNREKARADVLRLANDWKVPASAYKK